MVGFGKVRAVPAKGSPYFLMNVCLWLAFKKKCATENHLKIMENIKEIDKTRYVKFNAMGELALALILHPQVWRWGVHDFGNKEGLFLRFKVSGDHFQGWVYIGANTNDLFDIFFVKRFGQISFVLTDVHIKDLIDRIDEKIRKIPGKRE